MIRVAHVITGLRVGGAETALTRLAGRMDRRRFQHAVVSLGDAGDPMVEAVRAAGATVETAGLRPGLDLPKGLLRLVRLLRAARPDVIQAWMYHANVAALVASFAVPRRVPVIWNVRSSVSGLTREKRLTRRIAAMGGPLSRFVDAVVYCSRASAREHEQALGYDARRTRLIPNGFDLEDFRPAEEQRRRIRRQIGLDERTPAIVAVARWHPVKDHETLLRAASRLARPAALVLVGTGMDPHNQELSGLIRTLGLGGRVHLLGERRDVPALLAGMDLFVSSSRSEAFSNAIGEAMAAGLPAVVTDTGDSAWIVGETGSVVPPADPEALASALERMLAPEPAARRNLGKAARARIAELFSLDRTVSLYEGLYESVLTRSLEGPLLVRHFRFR